MSGAAYPRSPMNGELRFVNPPEPAPYALIRPISCFMRLNFGHDSYQQRG
jgi:hypothetical protein